MSEALSWTLLSLVSAALAAALWKISRHPAPSAAPRQNSSDRRREERTVSAPLPEATETTGDLRDRVIAAESEIRGLRRQLTELEETGERRHRSVMGAIHGAKGGRPRSSEPEEEAEVPSGAWEKLEQLSRLSPVVVPVEPPQPAATNGALPRLMRKPR